MSEIGHIDCGYLATIQATMDRIWTDPIANIDLIADVEAAKAVLENQQVNFSEITGRKTRIMSLEWLTKCDLTTTPCSDDCSIDGEDIVPECKEYEIECLRESTFKVAERIYRDRTIEMTQAIALNLMLAKKALDEWLAKYIVTGLVAAGGTNAFTAGIGHVDVAETHIPAIFWDDNIWGYFNLVNSINKYRSPYILTGINLSQYLFNRQHESLTEAGRAAMSKIGTIRRIYQDVVNVETIAPGYTFLINKTAVAFVNKAWYPLGAVNAEKRAGIYWMWSEASNNIPGIYYDIEMMETCLDNEFYQAYKVQLHGLFAENPYACDETNTGVLSFVCGGA